MIDRMVRVVLLVIFSLLAFAEAGLKENKACYNKYIQECFVDNNVTIGSCNVKSDQMKLMIDCVSGLARCDTSSNFYRAIILGYKRRAIEACQPNHCLTPMQNCMPKTKDLWHQLPTDAQGAADICSELHSTTVQDCLKDIAFDCENVKLPWFKQCIDVSISLSSYYDTFCNNNQASCLMMALKELPASYLSFYESGRLRFLSQCINRDTVNAATNATLTSAQCLDPASMKEYESALTISSVYEDICGDLCIVEAEECFEAYFGKKAKEINCSGDKAALLSCLDKVESSHTCSSTEIAEIDDIRASVNANC